MIPMIGHNKIDEKMTFQNLHSYVWFFSIQQGEDFDIISARPGATYLGKVAVDISERNMPNKKA